MHDPAGSGTQYAYCTTDADCAPTYTCVNTGGTFPYCLQFCTIWTQCPDTVWEDCYFFLTPQYVYSQEWKPAGTASRLLSSTPGQPITTPRPS